MLDGRSKGEKVMAGVVLRDSWTAIPFQVALPLPGGTKGVDNLLSREIYGSGELPAKGKYFRDGEVARGGIVMRNGTYPSAPR